MDSKTTSRRGRPSEYTHEKGDKLCALIASGTSVTEACKRRKVTMSTLHRWLREHGDFAVAFQGAHVVRCDGWGEEILVIADGKDGKDESIAERRLRIDARKWLLSKLMPRKYGDFVAAPPPPPPEPLPAITDAKLIDVQAEEDPVAEAFAEFEKALTETPEESARRDERELTEAEARAARTGDPFDQSEVACLRAAIERKWEQT